MDVGFGGRDMVSLLLSEARQKPVIAALVNRVGEMTMEDIDAAVVPLPWYRIALKKLKQREGHAEAATQAAAMADVMGVVEVVETRGMILRYSGPDTDLRPPAKGPAQMTIPIQHGDLLFFTPSETWLGAYPIGNPNIACDVVEQDVARSYYTHLLTQNSNPEVVEGSGGQLTETNGLFRFQRLS